MDNEIIIFILLAIRDICLAFFVAVGFAALFNAPVKAIITAGILGGLGHCLRYIMIEGIGMGLIFSTLSGCLLIGFLGIFAAHKIHTPPIIFTMPACITMIPGLYAYRTMLGFIRIVDGDAYKTDAFLIPDTFHNLVLTSSLLFCLAIGLSVAVLLFRKQSVKNIKPTIPKIRKK